MKIFIFVMQALMSLVGLTDEEKIETLMVSIAPFVEMLRKEAKKGDNIKIISIIPADGDMAAVAPAVTKLLIEADGIACDIGFNIKQSKTVFADRLYSDVFRDLINYFDEAAQEAEYQYFAEVSYADQKTLLEVAMAYNYAMMHNYTIHVNMQAHGDCALTIPVNEMQIANCIRQRKDHLKWINKFLMHD